MIKQERRYPNEDEPVETNNSYTPYEDFSGTHSPNTSQKGSTFNDRARSLEPYQDRDRDSSSQFDEGSSAFQQTYEGNNNANQAGSKLNKNSNRYYSPFFTKRKEKQGPNPQKAQKEAKKAAKKRQEGQKVTKKETLKGAKYGQTQQEELDEELRIQLEANGMDFENCAVKPPDPKIQVLIEKLFQQKKSELEAGTLIPARLSLRDGGPTINEMDMAELSKCLYSQQSQISTNDENQSLQIKTTKNLQSEPEEFTHLAKDTSPKVLASTPKPSHQRKSETLSESVFLRSKYWKDTRQKKDYIPYNDIMSVIKSIDVKIKKKEVADINRITSGNKTKELERPGKSRGSFVAKRSAGSRRNKVIKRRMSGRSLEGEISVDAASLALGSDVHLNFVSSRNRMSLREGRKNTRGSREKAVSMIKKSASLPQLDAKRLLAAKKQIDFGKCRKNIKEIFSESLHVIDNN